MDLMFNSKMEAYYQTFFELQEKLRKSEEERLKLEMKFNELVQVSREEEQAHYKKLRCQYKKFMEEDKKRQNRNEKIIRTLERIESRVNMLSSKTERIKMLRRQYQNYLQRVSRAPVDRKEYFPPKIAEELHHEPKSSCDITILKKAFGKTNDEKIEILDKYLQSLKSQKDPSTTNKPKENNTNFNATNYFDEVSKKLNEGFNSNEANSIAEEIMNSIYARHYKTDLVKTEPKKISKFTVPHVTDRYTENNYGIGDTRDNFDTKNNHSSSFFDIDTKKEYPNKNYTFTNVNKGISGFGEKPCTLFKDIIKDRLVSDDNKMGKNEHQKSENIIERNKNLLSIDKSEAFSKKENGHQNTPRKVELDLLENEKQFTISPFKSKEVTNDILTKDVSFVRQPDKKDDKVIEFDTQKSSKEDNDKILSDHESSRDKLDISYNDNKTVTKETIIADQQSAEHCIEVENQEYSSNRKTMLNNEPSKQEATTFIPNKNKLNEIDVSKAEHGENNIAPVANEDILPMENQILEPNVEPFGHEIIPDPQFAEPNDIIENLNDVPIVNKGDEQQSHTNQTMCDEQNKQPVQYENSDQMYQANAELYEQEEQYDSVEQPIEQLYGENGKALEQYDENGQPVLPYEQDYNENSQLQHQTYDENQYNIDQHGMQSSENNPQYLQDDQLDQPYYEDNQYQEYDATQAEQNYDENIQSVQQYDENGQPIQEYNINPSEQFEEKDQPMQLYDENGQPNQQYETTDQVFQHYDENGQVIQQYDENGQPIYFGQGEEFQYDENGQIGQQFVENGQAVQSLHDESYQPYNQNEHQMEEYNGQPHVVDAEISQQYQGNPYEEVNQQLEHNVDSSEHPQNIVNDGEKEQQELIQNVNPEEVDNVNLPSKKKNVLDLLDTDTESMKQNTSKISNDSDFDFSNG